MASSFSSSSLMASSSSSTIPSNLATHEISQVQEEQTHIPKVNGSESKVNPVSNSHSHNQTNKKKSYFTYPFGSKFKKPKPGKESTVNPDQEARKLEEEARKLEENAKKKKEETEKEINAITKSIKADFHSIENASRRIKKHEGPFKEAKEKFGELKDANAKDLRDFKKVVKTMKQQISTQDKKDDDGIEEEALVKQLRAIATANKEVANEAQLKMMPNLFEDSDFENTLQFLDFKARYNELPFELKLCLLCFAVFPENVEIKRRVLVYWWVGEGFVPPRKDRPEEKLDNTTHWEKFDLNKNNPDDEDFTPEHWANHYFKTLLNMGFIESAQKKPNPKVDICKMHPFVRSMLTRIAEKADFFEFDGDGTVSDKFSKSLRACLLSGNTLTETVKEDDKGVVKEDFKPLKNLHAMINVDESILDFKQDTLSKMRNANVLYLGRWQSLGTHHIEVDDTKILDANKGNILDGLQNIKNLKFLSLQGISRITDLPKSILKLQNLTILDIRACHNLETIPDDIGCLVNLTHLDMSECYLLDEMPKGISKLTNLQVLSGFVVLETENKKSCTLEDLKGFLYLRKLSIHSGSDHFPTEKDLKALNQFEKLSKLTIAWGRGSVNTQRPISDKLTTTVDENEKESNKEGTAIAEQGNGNVNLSKDETLKKENSGENTKEAGFGKQDSEKDYLEERNNKERTEKTREIKGNVTREIVEDLNASTHTPTLPSKKVVFSPDTMKKELDKREKTVVSQVAKSPKQKPLTGRLKGLLGFGPEGKLVKKLSTKKIDNTLAELPSLLTKLDLQCLPGLTHEWLRPEKLLGLEKLYIRGGKFSDLGQFHDLDNRSEKRKWEKVTELRLKYLDEVEMEWRELLELFPKLDYLEKVDCPKLSFFPCDEIGVWTKKKIVS